MMHGQKNIQYHLLCSHNISGTVIGGKYVKYIEIWRSE
jgi:hypothetical protein